MELSHEQEAVLRTLDEAADACAGGESAVAALPRPARVALQLVVDMAGLADPVEAFLGLELWLQQWVVVRRRYAAAAWPAPAEGEPGRLALETVSRQLKASHERLTLLARAHFLCKPGSG